MSYTKVESVEQLKELSSGESPEDFFIFFGGIARSSKRIHWLENEKLYYVYNEIDDSEEEIPEPLLYKSMIYEAIKKGALYKY